MIGDGTPYEGLNKSSFGELTTAQYMPLTSWAFTYSINPGLINKQIIGNGTITNDLGHAVLTNGTGATDKVEITTVRASRYIPKIGGSFAFTAVFDIPRLQNQQVIGLINGTDGWAFGYNGLEFGILRKVNNIEYWIPQTDWNVNKMPLLNPQLGNVYFGEYQWLGYGKQEFFIESNDGKIVHVHTIKFANTSTETSILNPNLPLSAYVINFGNTIPVTLKTPSASAGLYGDGFNDAISTNVSGDYVGTVPSALTDTPLLSLRMGSLYKGKPNRLFSQVLRLVFAAEGSKPVLFRAYIGGTVTGGTWSYISEELSPLEINNTATGYTPGIRVGAFPVGKSGTLPVDLIASMFRLYANQQITITATTQGASDIVVSANFKSFV